MSSKSKAEPKKPYISPYLTPIPSFLKTKVGSATSLSGSAKPANMKKKSISQNLGLLVNGKSQSTMGSHNLSLLTTGNLEKLQLAMTQLCLDTKLKAKGIGKSPPIPNKSSSGTSKMSARGSKADIPTGVKAKSKKQRPGTTLTHQASEILSKDCNNNAAPSSNIAMMGDTIQPSVKSILKLKSQSKAKVGGTGNQNWRRFLLGANHTSESGEKANAANIEERRPSKKNVHFHDKVRVHYVPYETRGSTEWQHNLMMSRENAFANFLKDPRLNSLMCDLGLHSSPMSPFLGSPTDALQNSMSNSRLFRRQRQNYF